MKIIVRFMSLEGKFALLREESFADFNAAKAAVEAHAAAAGYTNVKLVDDPEGDDVRFTARTPGGRSGRNIAFADEHYDEAEEAEVPSS